MGTGAGMSRRTKILIALAVGLFILLIAVAVSVRISGAIRDEIAADLENHPTGRFWAGPLREYYPSDYRDLLDRLATARLAGGDAGDRAARSFIDEFMARKIDAIASAPDEQLFEIAPFLAEVIRAEQGCDPVGGTNAGTSTVARTAPGQIMGLVVSAAHAGEISGRRPRRRANAADFAALRERIAAMDPEGVRALRESRSLSRMPRELRCRHIAVTFRTMAELPAGAVIVAEAVRRQVESRR